MGYVRYKANHDFITFTGFFLRYHGEPRSCGCDNEQLLTVLYNLVIIFKINYS